MKYGISTSCFYPLETEKGLLEIAKRHIPYAEVFVDTFCEIKKDFLTEMKKTADFYGTQLVSMHPFSCAFEPFMLFTEYERRFNDALELHRYYFDAMNTIGAKIFVFHGDRIGSSNKNEMYFERFAKLRDLGKEYGVIVAQENVERCKSRNMDFLSDMIKYLDNDVSLVFDNKQAFRCGISYESFIERFKNHIIHVHISDNSKDSDCIAIGKGDIDVSYFLSKLVEHNYTGCVIVELYNYLLDGNEDIFASYNKLIMSEK